MSNIGEAYAPGPVAPLPESQLGTQAERSIAEALRRQAPVRGLPGAAIENVRLEQAPFDFAFEILSGGQRVSVLAEVKADFSPRRLAEIAPWIRRLQSLQPDAAIAVAAPSLSPQAQAYCVENGIGFFDLAGNIFISVPGRFTLQRLGMRDKTVERESRAAPPMNVFSGRTSRVLRALLEAPREWTIKAIADELSRESQRLAGEAPEWKLDLRLSMGTVSKAAASLEDQLLIRRKGGRIAVPEPSRLLRQWAEKYRERYRWRLRDAVQIESPLGVDVGGITAALRPSVSVPFAATGAAAVADVAPWVEADVIDFFTPRPVPDAGVISLRLGGSAGYGGRAAGPRLRFIVPYDPGVFMYCRRNGQALEVSLVQAYLDIYARGGRDLKQADYLLERAIEPRWRAA